MAYELSVDMPNFYNDPYVGKTQDTLFPFYSSLLQGNINDYYAPIGEYGGPELDNILNLTQRDMTKSLNENLARRKLNGGLGLDLVAKNIGDVSANLRWSDFLRAMEGRKSLLGLGTSGLSDVRNSALNNQGSRNQFNLGIAGLETDIGKFNIQSKMAQDAAEQQMWADIIGGVSGIVTDIAGYGMMSSAMKK